MDTPLTAMLKRQIETFQRSETATHDPVEANKCRLYRLLRQATLDYLQNRELDDIRQHLQAIPQAVNCSPCSLYSFIDKQKALAEAGGLPEPQMEELAALEAMLTGEADDAYDRLRDAALGWQEAARERPFSIHMAEELQPAFH